MRHTLTPRRPPRIAILAVGVLVFVIVATGINALFFPAQAAASSSSLEVLDGVVAVSRDGTQFTEGRDGDLLQQGDVVRTGDDSHAVLTFFDGSTIEVEPNSQIVVEALTATPSGDIVMKLRQDFGRTWHVVSRALTPNSKYEVDTPTATASVRGTAFLVTVAPSGRSNFQTTDGHVAATAGGKEVSVLPGFETNVDPGGTPPEPPSPTPDPPALIRIVIEQTPNAAVTDAKGRTVGVLNGLPVRYVPGSTVQVVDGKLVLTIPNPTLGRVDTHVQPAKGNETTVDVNVQVIVNGNTVGNVVEHRAIDTNGIAKGGVVVTTDGMFIIPDSDAQRAKDPSIGRIPPPPAGGIFPFGDPHTAAPTAVVPTGDPSFVPRFNFDPRLVASTATPPPPTPSALPTFAGAFQPFVAQDSAASATPAPNANLIVFTPTTVPSDLSRLSAATPTPAPTFLIQRTLDPTIRLATPEPATPTPEPTLLLSPRILVLPTSSPTPAPIITARPIASAIILLPPPTDTPAPTVAPTPIPRDRASDRDAVHRHAGADPCANTCSDDRCHPDVRVAHAHRDRRADGGADARTDAPRHPESDHHHARANTCADAHHPLARAAVHRRDDLLGSHVPAFVFASS